MNETGDLPLSIFKRVLGRSAIYRYHWPSIIVRSAMSHKEVQNLIASYRPDLNVRHIEIDGIRLSLVLVLVVLPYEDRLVHLGLPTLD